MAASGGDFPFDELKVCVRSVVRKFSGETDDSELVWHRDREDRVVEATHETDWMFQFDNQLPIRMDRKIAIPAGVYHRIIKGTGDLTVKVIKL